MEKTIELEELSEFHIAKYAISDFTYLINIKSSLQAPSILRDRVGMTKGCSTYCPTLPLAETERQ